MWPRDLHKHESLAPLVIWPRTDSHVPSDYICEAARSPEHVEQVRVG